MKLILKLVFITALLSTVRACVDKFSGRKVKAAGDWQSNALWNAADPDTIMKLDTSICSYTFAISGLKANTPYKWKVLIDTWNENYGCSGGNGPDCSFTSNADGQVRFKFKIDTNPPQLTVDFAITTIDLVVKPASCSNKFSNRKVKAAGDWQTPTLWNAADLNTLMNFDADDCVYTLSITGLKANFAYKWKVAIDDLWAENYGCSGLNGPDCPLTTNANGAIRFKFSPATTPPQLTTDYNVDSNSVVLTTPAPTTTLPGVTTPQVFANPVKPCTSTCPACTNNLSNKLIRASGDWTIDAGSPTIWNGAEPQGLMTFEQQICAYTLVITGLKKNFDYKWKITVDNAWKENYGCTGLAAADCGFKTNSAGAVRFVVKANNNVPQLTTDFNVAECGDGICEEGETCSYCQQDCGECPPAVCGDGVCEDTENFMTCPLDCKNELPGCDRFNDESCKSGSQISANDHVGKRRWQTPKPGTPNYIPGFQDNWALVGYADIRYTSTARNEADVCIIAIHKNKETVSLTYYFNGAPQAANCKRFSSSHKSNVALKVEGSDGTKLEIAAVELIWNNQALPFRQGDYRNGQKGAIPEMFGWPHKDVEKECEIIAKAGYLGVKLFPVHEQVISYQPFNDGMNPWYFMYQPVSYKLDGRSGTREELISLINKCRSYGLRVYVDIILNHFSGAGNDLLEHRNPSAGCTKWGNKTSSAPIERQSPYFTHAYTYQYNPNTGEAPSNEFPGAALGPEDFHCERSLGSWSDLFILNNGWLVGLVDIDTSKDNVRERQAAYLVELLSLGVSGFRIDAAKHISPEDMSAIFKKVQAKMGGKLPDDFFVWLEILTGGEAGVIWFGPSWYGTSFETMLMRDLGSWEEVEKIKMWDGLYPKEPQNNPISKKRVAIQNDDHDQQVPGSSSRDMGPFGCVLVKNCPENEHRNFEKRLFENPNGVSNNAEDWPIRFILSSFYHTYGMDGIPDGLSDCSLCKVTCASCKQSVPYMPAYDPSACGYKGNGYTRVHRDVSIINSMRKWIGLGPISGADIGLPGC